MMGLLLSVALSGAAQQQPPAGANSSVSGYVLGPYDQLAFSSANAEEINGLKMQIDGAGDINVPLIGRFHAADLTTTQLEAQLSGRIARFVRNPQISVTVAEFHSQPVSVLGAVTTPGVHKLRGRTTLVEVLSLAGGLRPDAGYSLKIVRDLKYGSVPLKNARVDAGGRFSVAQVSLRSVLEASNPEENILIYPHDVITVPRADMVYVVGQVTKAGGFVLGEREHMSVLQALALAGGLERDAAPGNAKILRSLEGAAQRQEIAVNLKRIVVGKDKDVPLESGDILFIPSSTSKRAAVKAAEAAVQTLTGVVIWRGAHF
jgi:polysaccharide export outer membrane protein